MNNEANVVIRIEFDGAANNGGTNEVDNVSITAVPEPSSLILVAGLCGLVVLRRRNR